MFFGSITLLLSIAIVVLAIIAKIGWVKSVSVFFLAFLTVGSFFTLYTIAKTKEGESHYGLRSILFGQSREHMQDQDQQEIVSVDCRQRDYSKVSRDARFYVVRIDDVQDDYYYKIVQQMIYDSSTLGIKTVVGVIPEKVTRNSPVSNLLNKNKCAFEMAQHGLDHDRVTRNGQEFAEFEILEYEEAYQRLLQGKNILSDIYAVDVSTFIPPENLLSEEATRALEDFSFKHISSNAGSHFDSGPTVYEYHTKKIFDPEQVLSGCEDEWSEKNLCVITIHPQDFTKLGGAIDVNLYVKYFRNLLVALQRVPNAYPITFDDYSKIYNY